MSEWTRLNRKSMQLHKTHNREMTEEAEEQWLCSCNYSNIGCICTKCGKPRERVRGMKA